jgi:hypothetical protein
MSSNKERKNPYFEIVFSRPFHFLLMHFALNHSVRANGNNAVRSLGLSVCQDLFSDSKHKIIPNIVGKYISLDKYWLKFLPLLWHNISHSVVYLRGLMCKLFRKNTLVSPHTYFSSKYYFHRHSFECTHLLSQCPSTAEDVTATLASILAYCTLTRS